METIIYRKSDKFIVGYAFPRRTVSQTDAAIQEEMNNVLNSELGGVAEDYDMISIEKSTVMGKELYINDTGEAAFRDKEDSRAAARLSANIKLKGLGLNDEEIKSLIGD